MIGNVQITVFFSKEKIKCTEKCTSYVVKMLIVMKKLEASSPRYKTTKIYEETPSN